jgi:hypothetical protein
MQTIHELNAQVERLNKLIGADKPSPTRVRGIMKQLVDNSLLAIGTVAPPIRQDEEVPKTIESRKKTKCSLNMMPHINNKYFPD